MGTPGDPAIKNAWGTLLNGNDNLLDTAVAGVLSLNVAGSSNVALTYVQGAADQSRNPQFVLTGVLTGNILILWPQTVTRNFGVVNNTTGNFTVTLCVNNGSGGAAGAIEVIPQGVSAIYYSDGTNIELRSSPLLTISGSAPLFDVNLNAVSAFGLIYKTGIIGGGGGVVTFPTPFPTNLLAVWAVALESPAGAGQAAVFASAYPLSTTQMKATANSTGFSVQWHALGN